MPVPVKIYRNDQIELLRKHYIEEKMSTTQIALNSVKIFGFSISNGTIYKELIKNGIPVRGKSESVSIASCTLDRDKSFLSEELIEWVDGFLLGDGGIHFTRKSKTPFIGSRFHMGSVQKEWTDYGMSGFASYQVKFSINKENRDKKHPNPLYCGITLTHPDIIKQAIRWYGQNVQCKKAVPSDVRITPQSLLLWYLGDGSISKIGGSFFIRLAACAFSSSDIDNTLIPKLKALGIEASRDQSKNDIRISGSSIGTFFNLIGKRSPIACYQYKFEYPPWFNLHRVSDIIKNDREKWRVQYLYKIGKLDCQKSPGDKLILFNDEQRDKLRKTLDEHKTHDDYEKPEIKILTTEKPIRVSDIIKNDTERWNARYFITHGIIEHEKNSTLTMEQAVKLREKLDLYGEQDAIPSHRVGFEFRKYKQEGFPYYKFTDEHLRNKIETIANFSPIMSNGLFKWDGFGTEIASYFHPQMFKCRKKGKISAIEFFNSDIDFRRGIKKIIALYPKITPSNVREICCNEVVSSRINNFPPRVAMTILKHLYGGKRITVLDPCAGFSGRLLGAYCSGAVDKYIGIDLSEETYMGLLKTKQLLNSINTIDGEFSNNRFLCDIIHGNCLNVMDDISEKVDFVYTSPPFLDEEKYMGVDVVTDYNKWKDVFIRPFIEKTCHVLKNGGKLAVYTEAIRRNDFPVDFCNIANDVGFLRLDDINFKMPARENLRKERTSRVVKVIVFQKKI